MSFPDQRAGNIEIASTLCRQTDLLMLKMKLLSLCRLTFMTLAEECETTMTAHMCAVVLVCDRCRRIESTDRFANSRNE